MTTANYTTLLGLALPTTGDLSGQWGNEVNDYISKYVDSSVAGTQTISGSQTAVTLSRANGVPLSQAGSSSTGSSQYQVINCTGNPAGTLTVTIDVTTGSPALSNSTYSQTFAVINGTSTSQSVVVRATTTSGTSTGVTLVSGEKALIAWNGSDFIKVATSTVDGVSTIAFGTTGLTPSSATSGAVTVAGTLVAANGGTGQSTYTTGDLLYATGSTALSKLGIGTNGQILTSTGTAPQWSTLSGVAVTTFSAGTTGFTPSSATSGAVTLAGTLATTNGGTGLTSFTANGLVYASSTSALTTGSALTFDGTNLSNTRSVATAFSGSNSATWANGIVLTNTATPATGVANLIQFGGTSNVNSVFGVAQNSSGFGDFVWASYSGSFSEQMRLTSTGLGIGTSSPATKLDVVGGSIRVNEDGAGTKVITIRSNYAGVDPAINVTTNNSLLLMTNNTIQATLSASGNLGLGVTPSGYLANKFVINTGTDSNNGITIASATNRNGSIWFADGTTGDQAYRGGVDYQHTTDTLYLYSGGLGNFQLTAAGNLGLGVTPSTISTGKNLEVGFPGNSIYSYSQTDFEILSNAYYNGGYKFGGTGQAMMYAMGTAGSGIHSWHTSTVSGSAGGNVAFTQAMTLDSSGRLLVGLTSSSLGSRLEVKSSNNLLAGFTGGDASGTSYFVNTNGSGQVNHYATWATAPGVNAYHAWWVTASGGSQTQAMTLDASGNLAVGATSTSYRMEVVAPSGDNITALFRSGDATAANNAGGGFRSISSATAASRIAQLWLDADGANLSGGDYFYIQKNGNSGTADIVQYSNAAMTFATNATERARISSDGTFRVKGAGTAGSTDAVQFSGSAPATTLILDSSGNLGVGTGSPIAFARLTVAGTAGAQTGASQQVVISAPTTTAGQGAGIRFTAASGAQEAVGVIGVVNEASGVSGAMTFHVYNAGANIPEYMRISSAGNVGIGTSSPDCKLHVEAADGVVGGAIRYTAAGVCSGYMSADPNGLCLATDTAGITFRTGVSGNDPTDTGTERARITSDGYFKASNNGTYLGSTGTYHEINQSANDNVLFIRSTSTAYSVDGVQLRYNRNTTNNTFYALSYYNDAAGAYKLRIADSGDVTNTNGTYGTISDAKMKTDIVDAGSQWADIKAIRFRKFKMKNDPSGLVQLGVVAQELEQTSPGLVDEHIDRDGEGNDLGTTTKSVKTSVLLMKAAVALQEAMARIEQLEAKVAALEAK